MKYTIFLLLAALVFVGSPETVNAQDSMDKKETSMEKKEMSMDKKEAMKFPGIQKSPTDISYMRAAQKGPVHAKVIYSRPYKNERVIFGELVPYGKVWRTGADEATEITFYKDVMFGGKDVKAGTYAMFTVPNKDSWDIILNKDLHQWGAFTYDDKMDVVRVKATPKMMDDAVENFSIIFDDKNMILAWDKTMVAVPVMVK
ncbi:MAG: DUF2911 domain-containing protein [Acidobacteriota bacterium]|jgi:hypothetical protein|nr:DUF2911 domain-containing protein [Acidobacteriota bacterium]